MNSRYRERKYNASDNDRLLRALSQPVQAWDKKWTHHSTSKNFQTFKWIKSDRVIEYEKDESDEEPEPMETEQEGDGENVQSEESQLQSLTQTVTATTSERTSTITATTIEKIDINKETTTSTTTETQTTGTIPGGQSSVLVNKTISTVQQEEDDDDSRSITPKLDDISDVDERDNDDEDNDLDSINDPSKHPALAPHAHARMTDDDMTDSTAATPQTTTEENTPMPMLEDEPLQGQQPHPLSQEILSGATQFLNNNEDNDSSAIQTPEDQHHNEPMEQ